MQRLSKWFPIAVGAYILGMLAYVILKAWNIPFTYDEAFSFSNFASLSVPDVMRSPQAFNLANNHVLNTLLMKLMMLFGNHPILLRLPNLLAYGLFLYSSYCIARLFFSSKILQFSLLLALSLNPMLSEFFSLARGYGLGIGLLMFSVLQLMLLSQDKGQRSAIIHTNLCLAASVLCAYSSFSFLLPAAMIFLLLTAIKYSQSKDLRFFKKVILAVWVPVLYGVVLFWLIYQPINYLIAAKALYRGGSNNFFSDTWTSIISDLLGYRSHDFDVMENGGKDAISLTVWSAISLLVLVVSFIIAGKGFAKRNDTTASWPAIISCVLMLGCIIELNTLFYANGTPFITFRVALYLYPLIILVLFSAIKSVAGKQLKTAKGIAVGLCILLAINFLAQLNISTTRDWRFDAFITKMGDYIVADKGTPSVNIASYHLMQPALEFYTNTTYKDEITLKPYSDSLVQCCSPTYDYLYFPRIRAEQLMQDYRIVQAYDDSTYLLFKRK